MEFNFAFSCVRLIVGGILCFLAILLMSKTRNTEWMFIVGACLSQYFFEVLNLLVRLGLIPIRNTSVLTFLYYLIPSILMIAALIIKLIKKRE